VSARGMRALAALALSGALLAAGWPLARDLLSREVRSVRVAGEFQRVSRPALERAVREELAGARFFEVDVERVRRAALGLPWVREATVRRAWPDAIHIAVVERLAVARWNDEALLEDDASVFVPSGGPDGHGLARLEGPDGRHAEVLAQFKRLALALGSLAGGVTRLALSPRGQWQIGFGNGLTLVPPEPLDVDALERLAGALPAILGDDLARAARIDLRYANGFAVRWRDPGPRPEEGGRG